jgi:alginate O-acetyltransferase complex protein AlgJ
MVLVGTSYSANPNWSFVEALKLALSQDILNYAVEGQGPIAPMQTYLQQLDPVDAPPVVIWEFPIRYLSDPDLLSPIKILTGDDNA